MIVALGALVALPARLYRYRTMRAFGTCFIVAGLIGIGAAVIGYVAERREIAPGIFPLHIALPIVSSLFIAAAIILVKR